MLAELLYELTDEDLKTLLECKKMLWTIRLNPALASFGPSLSGNFVQIEPVEPIIEAASEPVEPPNEPPPVYFEHEFLFVDEPGDAADDPPPVYSVPFIDPSAYENMENAAGEPPPDEDFQPDGHLPGYNMEVFQPHPTRINYEANGMGVVRRIADGRLLGIRHPRWVHVTNSDGARVRIRRVVFVWECSWRLLLGPDKSLYAVDHDVANCNILNLDLN